MKIFLSKKKHKERDITPPSDLVMLCEDVMLGADAAIL